MTAGPALYLIYDVSDAMVDQAVANLEAVLDSRRVVSLLLTGLTSDDGGSPGASTWPQDDGKHLVNVAQRRGVAVLVPNDVGLAKTLGADGIHLNWQADHADMCAKVRDAVAAKIIVGADAGRSRHQAMELGEAGADYVAFGIPGHVEDRVTAKARQADLIAWWSELFEVACVAFDIDDEKQAGIVAAAGADFVAIKVSANVAPQQAVADVAKLWSAASASEAVPSSVN